MEKCYKLLHKKFGKMNTNCMKCAYWKKSVKNQTTKTCYDYFDCKEDCAYKEGKVPGQQRVLKVKKATIQKKAKSNIDSEAFARALVMFMNEEKK